MRGIRGIVNVEIVIIGAMSGIFFVLSYCHFIFVLFVVGNMVSVVE